MTCTRIVHSELQNKTINMFYFENNFFKSDKNKFVEFSTRPAGRPDRLTCLICVHLMRMR